MNHKAEAWYAEGCPRGWAGVWWIFRAGVSERVFLLAMRIAPRGYRSSWSTARDLAALLLKNMTV